jgi:hypothetical protein
MSVSDSYLPQDADEARGEAQRPANDHHVPHDDATDLSHEPSAHARSHARLGFEPLQRARWFVPPLDPPLPRDHEKSILNSQVTISEYCIIARSLWTLKGYTGIWDAIGCSPDAGLLDGDVGFMQRVEYLSFAGLTNEDVG